MRSLVRLFFIVILLLPVASWAGRPVTTNPTPALGEAGLTALGACLVGIGGLGLLRRRKR